MGNPLRPSAALRAKKAPVLRDDLLLRHTEADVKNQMSIGVLGSCFLGTRFDLERVWCTEADGAWNEGRSDLHR